MNDRTIEDAHFTLGTDSASFDVEGILADQHRQLTTALQERAGGFDVEGILADLQRQDDTPDSATHQRHQTPRPAATVPDCPDWCQLNVGHRFESVEPDGTLVGYHEGSLGTIHADQAEGVSVTLARKVSRGQDGRDTFGPVFVAVTAGGAEFTDPHILRDLGDAIRKAAGQLEHLG